MDLVPRATAPSRQKPGRRALQCRVILTVYEMKRLGRDAAELSALADHLTAHGLVLEMLARRLPRQDAVRARRPQ